MRSIRCVLLSVLGLAACLAAPSGGAAETAEAKPALREVELVGYTRARHVMDLVAEVAGKVEKVTADKGEAIPASGVFAVLDPTFENLSLESNKARQAKLESSIAYLSKEVSRYESLVQKDLHDRSTLDKLANDLAQSRHELESLKVAERELRERIRRLKVKAPAGWRVIERNAEPGEWAAVGTNLGRVGDYSTLLIPFALSPQEYAAVRDRGVEPALVFPDEPGGAKTIAARIGRVSPEFDPQTRKLGVELAVDKGPAEMRGGLRAVLTLRLSDEAGSVLVPAEAVEERYEEFWMVRESGERVKVFVLGKTAEGLLRVRAENVAAGQRFKLDPEF